MLREKKEIAIGYSVRVNIHTTIFPFVSMYITLCNILLHQMRHWLIAYVVQI